MTNHLRTFGRFMMLAAQAHARWEIDTARVILGDKKRIFILFLLLLPIFAVSITLAGPLADAAPEILGGKKAYSPAFFSMGIFVASIFIGLSAGLITGCIGAGGGFVIAPALMSAGIRGILAVGTDLFHIFAKAIMGSVIHRRLGNVNIPLALVFLLGAIVGATGGGVLNRVLYEINPVLSDTFISTIYVLMLGSLGFYAISDFFRARKRAGETQDQVLDREGAALGSLPKKLQSINVPPMVTFDQGLVPGGRRISSIFLVLSGALVGFCAAVMGVGGGFLTFPIFVYMLGVSSVTTVGTDIFQIVFTAGYASISQYAVYGFIFYTLAMGMLLGSLVGIQIGALVTKVVKGTTIRGFYAMAVLAGFVNRAFALPGKLVEMEVLSLPTRAVRVLDLIGIWSFFIVIAIFGVWVIGTFFANLAALRVEGRSGDGQEA